MSIATDFNLKSFNTMGIAAKATAFVEIQSIQDLEQLDLNQKLFILGGGSNILFGGDFDGLVLKVNILGKEIIKEDDEHVWIRFGAGENWHESVLYAVENNWGGIENMSLIPGTIGAAPIQNIGAYGTELKDVFYQVDGVMLDDLQPFSLNLDECNFGYRDSIFKNELKSKTLISHVTLRLTKEHTINASYGAIAEVLKSKNISAPNIKDISEAVIEIRQSKLPDPKELGNAGSFFKNPTIKNPHFREIKMSYPNCPGYPQPNDHTKVPAGWLIEQCGWKGKRVGETGAHAKQALVLVNYGNATGKEILNLSKQIQDSVYVKFGIKIEREVTLL